MKKLVDTLENAFRHKTFGLTGSSPDIEAYLGKPLEMDQLKELLCENEAARCFLDAWVSHVPEEDKDIREVSAL